MTDDELDNMVDDMDIDELAAYARAHNVGDWDIGQWLDDDWPLKETELRITVSDHMKQEQGG